MSVNSNKKKAKTEKQPDDGPYAVTRGKRIFANTNANLLHHARVLVSRHVPDGESGTIQDLINFVLSGLVMEPETCDRLYREGKKLYPKIKDTPVNEILAERRNKVELN